MYQKYRKMTEAALNSEPIPLGHRQTIRRYFELIRPQGDEAKQADPPRARRHLLDWRLQSRMIASSGRRIPFSISAASGPEG